MQWRARWFIQRCSLTPDLPVAVKLERSGLHAIVSIARRQGMNQVHVRFDVPEGMTLVLHEHAIVLDTRHASGPRRAMISHINPVAPAREPETPAIDKLVLPVDTPMRGGRMEAGHVSFDRHYWIAAPIERELEGDVWLTLPEVLVDGEPIRFPEVRFAPRFTVGTGFVNC